MNPPSSILQAAQMTAPSSLNSSRAKACLLHRLYRAARSQRGRASANNLEALVELPDRRQILLSLQGRAELSRLPDDIEAAPVGTVDIKGLSPHRTGVVHLPELGKRYGN